jgi:hypothetical protein
MPARNNRGVVTIRSVTYTAVAREQLGKHVSTETNLHNSRRAVFSVWSMLKGCEKDREDCLSQLSSGVPSEQLAVVRIERVNSRR